MEKIPTISIKNSNERKAIISKDILKACQDVGFFTIIDHDLDINSVSYTHLTLPTTPYV